MGQSDRIQGRFARNDLLVIPVEVINAQLNFMVDTGASYVSLRKDIAQSLAWQIDMNKTIRIVTASRQPPVLASIMEIAAFRVGGVLVQNLPILLLDLPEELGVDGLVGMNFLRRFRFCIEPDTATLVLRKLQK